MNNKYMISNLRIVAKQSNQEAYLIAYKYKEGMGFTVNLENNTRTADDKIQFIRQRGFWYDFQCSEKLERRILEKAVELKPVKID